MTDRTKQVTKTTAGVVGALGVAALFLVPMTNSVLPSAQHGTVVGWDYPSNELADVTFTLIFKTNLNDKWTATNVIGTNRATLPYQQAFWTIARVSNTRFTNATAFDPRYKY